MPTCVEESVLPQPADPAEPAIVSPLPASRRVLIVEDEKRLREMLHTAVTEMGLLPTSTGSAAGALKILARESIAVALVDLNLPGMGGLELVEEMVRQKIPIQVVILTGFGDLAAARQAIRLEVCDFLTKPCGMGELEVALDRARSRWLERQIHLPPVVADPVPAPAAAAAPAVVEPPPESVVPGSVEQMERDLILAALKRHNGNRQAAAIDVGISVRKLYYRLQQYQRAGLMPGE
jgi:DNA-binding NtrC family response regulator